MRDYNAQINHDLDNRWIITCKPVRICRRAWIGAARLFSEINIIILPFQ